MRSRCQDRRFWLITASLVLSAAPPSLRIRHFPLRFVSAVAFLWTRWGARACWHLPVASHELTVRHQDTASCTWSHFLTFSNILEHSSSPHSTDNLPSSLSSGQHTLVQTNTYQDGNGLFIQRIRLQLWLAGHLILHRNTMYFPCSSPSQGISFHASTTNFPSLPSTSPDAGLWYNKGRCFSWPERTAHWDTPLSSSGQDGGRVSLLPGTGMHRGKGTLSDCDPVQTAWVWSASPLVARGKLLVALLSFLGLEINWGFYFLKSQE